MDMKPEDFWDEFEELHAEAQAEAAANPGSTWVMAVNDKHLVIHMPAVGDAVSYDGGRTWQASGPSIVYAGPERCENVWAAAEMVDEMRAGRAHPWLVEQVLRVAATPTRRGR